MMSNIDPMQQYLQGQVLPDEYQAYLQEQLAAQAAPRNSFLDMVMQDPVSAYFSPEVGGGDVYSYNRPDDLRQWIGLGLNLREAEAGQAESAAEAEAAAAEEQRAASEEERAGYEFRAKYGDPDFMMRRLRGTYGPGDILRVLNEGNEEDIQNLYSMVRGQDEFGVEDWRNAEGGTALLGMLADLDEQEVVQAEEDFRVGQEEERVGFLNPEERAKEMYLRLTYNSPNITVGRGGKVFSGATPEEAKRKSRWAMQEVKTNEILRGLPAKQFEPGRRPTYRSRAQTSTTSGGPSPREYMERQQGKPIVTQPAGRTRRQMSERERDVAEGYGYGRDPFLTGRAGR